MVNNKVAEAKFEEAATWICWDIENMPIPKGCKAEEISQKISSSLSELNYRGPISISAYGNMNHIQPSVKKALSSTGIVLKHVTLTSRDFSSHISDKLFGCSRNYPPPANLMLIARYEEASPIIFGHWQNYGYNALLAHPPNASDSFLASANTTLLWKSLVQ
ncbi:hypothetical protein N665_0072s0054 [Sinapis alba]|nr:hypothetical protein N665_0072s0054 [Sinapis alba]